MLIRFCFDHFSVLLQTCMAQLSYQWIVQTPLYGYQSAKKRICMDVSKHEALSLFFSKLEILWALFLWLHLLRSSCRQSIDVSMIAWACKRVRSAHGSPLSETTWSPSCTPSRKARPPSSTWAWKWEDEAINHKAARVTVLNVGIFLSSADEMRAAYHVSCSSFNTTVCSNILMAVYYYSSPI